jgi:DNA replication and repair protein RecF
VYIKEIQLTDFRNYGSARVEFSSAGALLYGPNGAGKTNILEAVHLLCIGRSQRGATRRTMIHHAKKTTCIEGVFVDSGGHSCSAIIGFDRSGQLSLRYNGAAVDTLRAWFGRFGVVSFGPQDIELIQGGPQHKRRFMDMLLSQLSDSYLQALLHYRSALVQRNALLGRRESATLLDIYDEQLCEWGAKIAAERHDLIKKCQDIFGDIYHRVSGQTEQAQLRYQPGFSVGESGVCEWKKVFYKTLKNRRIEDVERGFTTSGPHRDSFAVFLDSHPVRSHASQGQCRSLALSLRLGSVELLEHSRQEQMIFLVDDAFSELDDSRIGQLVPLLRTKGQVLQTAPADRPEISPELPRSYICQGTVTPR